VEPTYLITTPTHFNRDTIQHKHVITYKKPTNDTDHFKEKMKDQKQNNRSLIKKLIKPIFFS